MIVYLLVFTHQTDEDTDELYDISVSHGIEAAKQSVEDGDTSRHNDGHLVRQTDDDPQGTTYNKIKLPYTCIKFPTRTLSKDCILPKFSYPSRIILGVCSYNNRIRLSY